MMMALAAMHDLPCVLVPGGVTLLAEEGEDAGRVQSVGARFAHNQITLEDAAENLCRACATPGGGCQFLGTAATSQVVGEALGMSLTHSALAPSGHPIWLRYGAALGARRAVARIARHHHEAHSHRRLAAQRHDGARGVRRIDQPDSAPAGHRARGRAEAAHGRRLDRSQPQGPAPGRRAAQRPALASHRAGVSGRRRAGSDAAPAPRRPARDWMCSPSAAKRWAACSTGGRNPSAARACARCCGSATASIPTTSSWTRPAPASAA